MFLYVDNDVVIKLAEYELLISLYDIVTTLGHNVHVLESLPYVVGVNNPDRANKVFTSASSLEQIRQFLSMVQPARIMLASTLQVINSIDEPNLDEGELTLIGCAIESVEPGFCSGDKRAIRAVNKLVSAQTLTFDHCIIIILEHTLKILIHAMDVGDVFERILRKPDVDKAVKLCFQGATADTVAHVISALESYINDLKKKCPSLTFVELDSFVFRQN